MTHEAGNRQGRTRAQLREHYEVERELADALRRAGPHERRSLYATLYDELFRRVPHHPQLTRKVTPRERARAVANQTRLLARFLRPETRFLEIGAGDCALSFHLSRRVATVRAIDVSETISDAARVPENFELILSDGCSIPVAPASVDVAFSNQLMEHLHPDDAREQLQNILRALAPGASTSASPRTSSSARTPSRGI
jgi:SAM-dependent methyltransferase